MRKKVRSRRVPWLEKYAAFGLAFGSIFVLEEVGSPVEVEEVA
jgi:hypothetical protein